MSKQIADLTLADISSDGSGSQADLEAFQTACYAYARAHVISHAEAIDYLFGDGDFWARVQEWAPYEAAAAEARDAQDWDDGLPIEDDEPLACGACGGALVALGSLGRVAHFRCRACGLDSSFDDAALAAQLDAENNDPSEQPY